MPLKMEITWVPEPTTVVLWICPECQSEEWVRSDLGEDFDIIYDICADCYFDKCDEMERLEREGLHIQDGLSDSRQG